MQFVFPAHVMSILMKLKYFFNNLIAKINLNDNHTYYRSLCPASVFAEYLITIGWAQDNNAFKKQLHQSLELIGLFFAPES